MPLAGGKMTVQHCHQSLQRSAAKPCLEPLHRLRRERNFWHQHDGPLPLLQRPRNCLQIYLRLPTPCHAVKKEKITALRNDFFQRFGLFGIEFQWLGGDDLFVGVGVAFGDLWGNLDEVFVLKLADGLGGGASETQQFLQRDGAVLLDDVIDFRLPFGQRVDAIRAGQHARKEAFTPAFLFLSNGIGQHALEGGLGRAAIILGHPTGQLQHARSHQRLRADDFENGFERFESGRLRQRRHAAEHLPPSEWHFYARAHLNAPGKFRRDEVIKFPAQSNFQCHARDHASSFAMPRGRCEPNELTDLDAAPFFA